MPEGTETVEWYPAVDVDAIPNKEGRRVSYKNSEVALFNLGNEYLAIGNRCPHKAGPLADGIVAGRAVFCPLHNLKISLEHGCALGGGQGRVKIYPTKTVGDKVCIAFHEGRFSSPENSPEDETVSNEMDL